jgi:hypothetical protein
MDNSEQKKGDCIWVKLETVNSSALHREAAVALNKLNDGQAPIIPKFRQESFSPKYKI